MCKPINDKSNCFSQQMFREDSSTQTVCPRNLKGLLYDSWIEVSHLFFFLRVTGQKKFRQHESEMQ